MCLDYQKNVGMWHLILEVFEDLINTLGKVHPKKASAWCSLIYCIDIKYLE